MELDHFSHDHKLVLNEKNNLDPDEGISCLCFICSLPIFFTPYYSCSVVSDRLNVARVLEGVEPMTTICNNFFIHERCVHLPQYLKHVSRDDAYVEVVSNREHMLKCHKCHRKCKTVAWRSRFSHSPHILFSLFRRMGEIDYLDALCVAPLELRIFHRSHEHELIPMVHGEDFTVCRACGLKHENEEPRRSSLFYWCWWCNFWIHENCATLPNYIRHDQHHDHPLALTYALPQGDLYSYCCGICTDTITSLGVYFCGTCSYYAHIKCATHNSKHYKPVPSRQISDRSSYWIQFPMEDEDRSLVAYILEKTINQNNEESSSSINNKHEHPLVFHETSVNDQRRRALCNGCVQPISLPYYSCSQCTDYLIHKSCADLPSSIAHPAHIGHGRLVLLTNHDTFGFSCGGCNFLCNGFSYRCERCEFELDVQCAFLPKSIMHKAHDQHHVFHLINVKSLKYLNTDCCGGQRSARLKYVCTGCNFLIDASCAGLPISVRHKFDKHPLKLITGGALISDTSDITATTKQRRHTYSDENFCEYCEKEIYNHYWYYGCTECNQLFHIGCIPTVGKNSMFKLHANLNIPCHPHRLIGIRLLTDVSRNYRCGYCTDAIKNFEDELAFECLECNFTIHYHCAHRNFHAQDKAA